MKKYLAKQRSPRSLSELQRQIDTFVTYYNESRPHRGLGRRVPPEVFDTKVKAHPCAQGQSHLRIRHDKVDTCGKLTLRHEGKLRHIGVGAPFQRSAGRAHDRRRRRPNPHARRRTLRILTLEPGRDYHPQTLGWTSTMC
jgi:hypothetical protein